MNDSADAVLESRFRDIGYQHHPFSYYPPDCKNCNENFTNVPGLDVVNYMPTWLKYNASKEGIISTV
jgi:hypothetical protein